jgi:hypothetical protein
MTMQIVRHSYNPSVQTWGVVPNPNLRAAQAVRSANESGGLNNMGMINRVRYAKSGCSSCGGSK